MTIFRDGAIILGLALIAACGESPSLPQAQTEAAPAWRAPPRVEAVVRRTGVLELSGRAQPGGRVVMRDAAGTAFAATADAQGAFVLTVPTPSGDVTLRPEDQDGQSALPGPDVVVVLAAGPAVALSPGLASRRLEAGMGLAAVDSDGRMVIVSGRGPRGQAEVRVRTGAGAEMPAPVDARGVWSVRTDAAGLGGVVVVDGVEHRPVLAGAAPGTVIAAGEGRLIGWTAPDGATLSTWIPNPR